MNLDLLARFYERMFLIRTFEQTVEAYFARGQMRGTTHGSIGQEAIAVGVLSHVHPDEDFVTGTHRSHGHFLALTGRVFELASELMGKKTGVIHGRGGSQHLAFGNFLTNGITGGMLPSAVGVALAKKLKGEPGVVISFLGDGGMNEGHTLEALNLAGAFQTPNIFVLENNHYAMSTVTEHVTGGTFESRVRGFGLPYVRHRALDVLEIHRLFGEIYQRVRETRRPVFLEFETYRLCGHSKSDKREYVVPELEAYWRENDPLLRARRALPEETVREIEERVRRQVAEAFRRAEEAPFPDPAEELKPRP